MDQRLRVLAGIALAAWLIAAGPAFASLRPAAMPGLPCAPATAALAGVGCGLQPWMLVYIGPETLLPFASALAAVGGFVMMFWRRLLGWLRRFWRWVVRR